MGEGDVCVVDGWEGEKKCCFGGVWGYNVEKSGGERAAMQILVIIEYMKESL